MMPPPTASHFVLNMTVRKGCVFIPHGALALVKWLGSKAGARKTSAYAKYDKKRNTNQDPRDPSLCTKELLTLRKSGEPR